MAKSILEIILGLTDQTGGLKGPLANFEKLGKVALGVTAAGIAAAGVAIGAFVSKAIPAASDLNEAMNASSVVFGDASKSIQDFGKKAADSAGLSAAAFNQMAAQTGAMLTNFGFSNQKAADETIKLTQRSADLASIFNTDVTDALTAVQALMRGETEPARKFGVSMSQVSVEAKALELGFKKVNGAFDQNALTTARLALFYEQTDKIAGDFANTSDQLANGARVQKARWENFLAMAGTQMLPIVTKLQNTFMALAEKVLPRVLDAIGPVIDMVGRGVDDFINLVNAIASGKNPIDAMGSGVQGLAQQFTAFFQSPFFVGIGNLLSQIWGSFQSTFSQIMALVQTVLASLQAWWGAHGAAIIAQVSSMWEGVKGMFSAAVTFLSTLVNFLLTNISSFWQAHGESIMAVVQFVWDTIVTIFNTQTAVITRVFQGFTALLQGDFEGFKKKLEEAWGILWETIKNLASVAWGLIQQGFASLLADIERKVQGVIAAAQSALDWLKKVDSWNPIGDALSGKAGSFAAAGRAVGGDVYRGMPYIVGENGPEGFVPRQDGTIIPNNQLGMGGNTYYINTKDNPNAIVAAIRHQQNVERMMA